MAVLTRDEFFERVQNVVGTDTSDNTLTFIEDMTDTYNSLEERASGDGDWERRYHELDESWKEKYKKRFFSGGGSSRIIEEAKEDSKEKMIDYDDLFE